MSTTSTAPRGDIHQLIDQRLDAIDRTLLGLIPRQDRLSIVTQVETRLRELAEANRANAIEPHEPIHSEHATLPDARFDSAAQGPSLSLHPRRSANGTRVRPARRKRSRLALSSGVLGIVALALLFALPISYLVVSYVGVLDLATTAILGTHVAAVALGGTLAVVLSIAGLVSLQRSQRKMAGHGWAITGLSTGPLPMFVGGLIVLVVGLQLLAAERGNVAQVTTTSMPITVPAPSYYSSAPPCASPMPTGPTPYMPATCAAPEGYPGPAQPADATDVVWGQPAEAAAPAGPVGPPEPPSPIEPADAVELPGAEPHVAEVPRQSVD
jgi:hypothetical protein